MHVLATATTSDTEQYTTSRDRQVSIETHAHHHYLQNSSIGKRVTAI